MLESAHNQKAQALTAAQAAAVLQQAKDKAAAAQQTFDNILATAKVNISAASQQATAAYQSGQLNISQYNAATSRMNADTSRYNATKPTAGTAGEKTWTHASALSYVDGIRQLKAQVGSGSSAVAINPDSLSSDAQAILASMGNATKWTQASLNDYLTQSKETIDSATNYLANSGEATHIITADERATVKAFTDRIAAEVTAKYGAFNPTMEGARQAYALSKAQGLIDTIGGSLNPYEEQAILDYYNNGG
jgi:hypothetical protein